MIVDDSSFMRKSLAHILKSDASIEVVGCADDGAGAIKAVKRLHPDVVLLDIEMPVMDGLTALAHIMAECPTPVVMLSALDKKQADIAIKSLEYGAVDFIPKPSGVISYDIDNVKVEIIAKVKIAFGVGARKIIHGLPEAILQQRNIGQVGQKRIVVIGASTGGPPALAKVLAGLPRDLSAAVLVVQHMTPDFIPSFVNRLQWGTSLDISIANNNEVLRPGKVLIAPGGCHTMVNQNGDSKRIHLSQRALPHGVLPSIDGAMQSAAEVYGKATLGVVLTGIGDDGAKGLRAIKNAGGGTIVEDQSTCVVYGMPKAAIDLKCVDEIVPLPLIAQTILRMI